MLRKEGKLDEAIKLLEGFIQDEVYPPFLKNAYHNLACNLKDQGRYEEAIQLLNKAITYSETELDKALVIFLLGDIYHCIGDFKRSRTYYEQSKTVLIHKSNFYNKATIVKTLVKAYVKETDDLALEQLLSEIENISDKMQKKQLINVYKLEKYKLTNLG